VAEVLGGTPTDIKVRDLPCGSRSIHGTCMRQLHCDAQTASVPLLLSSPLHDILAPFVCYSTLQAIGLPLPHRDVRNGHDACSTFIARLMPWLRANTGFSLTSSISFDSISSVGRKAFTHQAQSLLTQLSPTRPTHREAARAAPSSE